MKRRNAKLHFQMTFSLPSTSCLRKLPIITSADVIIAGGEIFKMSASRFVDVSEEEINLRTVPTIVIAHTFCASPDTRISYRQC